MIKLKLSFGANEPEKEFKISDGELLKSAISKAIEGVPLGEFTPDEVFNAVVNGHLIESNLWDKVALLESDNVVVSPRIKEGESGQIFKQVLLVAVAVVASVLLTPATGATVLSGFAVAAVTIAASLALNALIPPPGSDLRGETGGFGGVEGSQMYSITGQSNQMKRLGVVPKVYGTHRVFPNIAASPYTEISVDPTNGEIIQYLVGIYDFGLGTPQISELKIGDTPLSSQSFTDFQIRFVDPNKPDAGDQYDTYLSKTFELYKGSRNYAHFSVALEDGDENIQVSDLNASGVKQEIVLDFACPKGLYGYSASGSLVERKINLDIDYAPIGTSDWKAYNDPSAVESYSSVGGTDIVYFERPISALIPTHALFNSYYNTNPLKERSNNDDTFTNVVNTIFYVFLRDPRKILVPYLHTAEEGDLEWEVGQTVYLRGEFIGYIQQVNTVPGYPQFSELVIDKPVPTHSFAYIWTANSTYQDPDNYTYSATAYDVVNIKSRYEDFSRAAIFGQNSNAVFASFRFTPKEIGQFQVRVRRISTEGIFSQQKADDVTWTGLTTAYSTPPVVTNKRHVFLEIKIKATNQLNGNIQNLSGLATQVLDVYDSGTETWSRQNTNNPAWVFVDLLTNEVNKKAVAKSRLHLDSILAWAAYCDVIPTPPPSQAFRWPRFSCNFILDYDVTLQGALFQICGAAQASLNIIDGKYGVLVDKLRTTPVQIFTPRNSSGFGSTRFYGPRPHGIKVKFIEPIKDWAVSEIIVYDNGYDVSNSTEIDDLTSFACTNHEQAWRFGRYMLAQNRLRQETMNLNVDFESLVCTRGDYVQISQDVMEVGGRPARVKAVSGNTITIDDAIDIGSLDYGYTYRSATGEIKVSTLTPLTSRTFSLNGREIEFVGQDTTGQDLDVYYRYGGVPSPIGSTRKISGIVGVFSGGDTEYELPEAPLNSNEILVWLNGIQRTDYTLSTTHVLFSGQDTTGQVFDVWYRYTGSASSGTNKKLENLSGSFAAGDTTYTLPEAPIGGNDILVWLDGVYRADYTLTGTEVRFVGQNTTGQVMDTLYRYPGGPSPIGSARKINALVGTYAGGNTKYTLPEGPLSDNDLIVSLNGVLRTEYNINGFIPAVGDLIVIGEVGKLVLDCIVKSISPNDDHSAQITLVERANEIFDSESTDTLPEYDPNLSLSYLPGSQPPKAVVSLTLDANTSECAQTQSGYNYYAEVSWEIPPGSVYEFFEIWANDGRGYKKVESTSAKRYKYSVDQIRLGDPHGIKVVAVASSGNKLQLIQMPEVTFTPTVKTAAPSNVESLAMSITNQILQLSWPSISDCDVASYELRFSPGTNDIWETSTQLQTVDRNVNSVSVQARTGVYFIKAINFAGVKSVDATQAVTTIPNLFNLNIIETLNDAPGFLGEVENTEKIGNAIVLKVRNAGTADTMSYFSDGYYYVEDLLDLGDIYSVRLQSLIRADGYRYGELLANWLTLDSVDHLNSSDGGDWNVVAEYRATNEILAMSDWLHLADIEHLNEGVGQGFTDWRPIPTIGDATGRVFQFRIRLQSITPNVTPRLFDATIKADMPDRTDSFENLTSHATNPTTVTYDNRFRGPSPSPNVQISIDNAETGDYWVFENKNLEGFQIRFYDNTNTQVVRQFDVLAKGYGARHTTTI